MNSKFVRITILILLATISSFSFSNSAKPAEKTIKFFLDISEGGSDSSRNLKKLQNYLLEEGCNVLVNSLKHPKSIPEEEMLFYFNAMNLKEDSLSKDRNLLKAKTFSGRTVAPAVVVRQNTATSIGSIDKMPVSIAKIGSKSGDLTSGELKKFSYTAQIKMLESGNHMGALSLLLHKDAFASIIDSGFASQWLVKNDLKVISKGNTQEAGGIFLNKNARLWLKGQNMLDSCIDAFSQLDRKNKNYNRIMQAFPDWLVGFDSANQN